MKIDFNVFCSSADEECFKSVDSNSTMTSMAYMVAKLKCKKEYWLVYILCAGYLIMGNILLFNLLIAIFKLVLIQHSLLF